MADHAAPLLDADLLRQLERLRLSTLDAIVAGLVGEREGRARAPRLEFADYRPYVPGDDLRRIDWNIYRRLGQIIVKVGVEDGRLSLAVLVDVSRSMRVGPPGKLRLAQGLATALGAIALLRGDHADVHVLGDGRARTIVRLEGPRQVAVLARELERLPESAGTGLEHALDEYARSRTRADVAILISDAHVPLDELSRGLRTLAASARTAVLLHVVSVDELETQLRGPLELRDAESGRAFQTTLDDEAAAEYAEGFARFADTVRALCRERGVRYVRARSDEQPLDLLLAHASDVAVTVG